MLKKITIRNQSPAKGNRLEMRGKTMYIKTTMLMSAAIQSTKLSVVILFQFK